MRLTGYGDFDWEPHGFRCGIPRDLVPFPTIEPVVLPRPGAPATFGISEVGAFTIPATFITTPENAIVLSEGFEAAWLYFFKRLNPYQTINGEDPPQLRGVRTAAGGVDGAAINIRAMVRLMNATRSRNINERLIDFVVVDLSWTATAASTASGTF